MNYKKLAEIGGYKNAASAATVWSQITAKIRRADPTNASAFASSSGDRSKASGGSKQGKTKPASKNCGEEESDTADKDEKMNDNIAEGTDDKANALDEKAASGSQKATYITKKEEEQKDNDGAVKEFIMDNDKTVNKPKADADLDDPWKYFDANHPY